MFGRMNNFLERSLLIPSRERCMAAKELINKNTKGPKVGTVVMSLRQDNLGR
jgi:hypothetical protein